jgi:LPS export ABC transporter protein LptC
MLTRFTGKIIILFALILGCREPEAILPSSTSNTPDQETNNFELVKTIENTVHWKLNADKARIFDRDEKIELTKVNVLFYDTETGEESSYLIADSGIINDKDGFMEAIGSVELKSNDGKILKAPRLFWNRQSDQIYCESEVEVNDGNTVIHGSGLKTDPELRRMEFKKIKTHTENPGRTIF